MARQIDPWLGVPQTAVLEENLLAVQMRLKGMENKLRELDARLGRVAQTASEARSDADRASGQTLALEAQLADIAGALLMLTDQLAAAGCSPGRRRPRGQLRWKTPPTSSPARSCNS